MRLRDKITMAKRPVVLYEILPPRIIDGTLESYAERISSLLSQTHIDGINIPEVHSEETRGKRPVEESKRAEPREFGKIIQDSVGVEAIINRVTVHGSEESQKDWLVETHENFGIENVILVGGESREIEYSGPSVIRLSEIVSSWNENDETEIFLGGISLPSRSVESERMQKKTENGINFFTTQVLYDSEDICKMLNYYDELCEQKMEAPKRILLSFASISTIKNLKFLKWLGVDIPEKTEGAIIKDESMIKSKSIDVSMEVLEDVLRHVSKNRIKVPIGLNIEHIMSYNFQPSVELLQKMSKRYRKFCMETDLYSQ